MPYASDNNAILIDNCSNLQNLQILLEVTEDIATTDGSGWSLQLNCYPPPGIYCQTSPVNWIQFIVIVQGGNLAYYMQYWAVGASTWPQGYNPVPGTSPWLPCWAHDFGGGVQYGTFASISGDTLPRESLLKIALATNSDGGVTAVTFTYTDPDVNEHTKVWTAPAVIPISAFELNFVGPPGGNATFTQGLTESRGIIFYTVSSGELSVQSGGVGSACGEVGAITAEASNMTYSDIAGAPAGTVTQTLQQPVSCAINNLMVNHQAQLGDLRKFRETAVSKHAAGQWVMEVLDRHSASLWLILASDEAELARPARELLNRAMEMVRDGRQFDDRIVDEALRVHGLLSCKLPASLYWVGPAGATVLRSLRGRTLEDGLKDASRTIRPRFVGKRKQVESR